jgi:hypothetical protein
MDCEKFDQHVIDALYDELDELTMASMKRHMESCSRCAAAFSGLRATREVAILPLDEPSDELESRILFAASAAQKKTPWHKKALRGLAWAGSHAMRPQLAMAAVFVLVIGSSLLLLRARPGTPSLAPVRVTERGEPSPERDEGAEAPLAAAQAAPTAAPEAPARGDGKEKAAPADDEAKASKGGEAQTALAEARSTEASKGCDAALAKYDDVGVRFSGTKQAADAMLAAAACHRKRGDVDRARELYGVLAKRDEYKAEAEEALNGMAPGNMNNQMAAASASPAATAPPTATATAVAGAAGKAVAAPASPAATAPGGGGGAAGKPVAAPAPKAAPAKPNAAFAVEQSTGSPGNSQAPGWGGSRAPSGPQKRNATIDSAR